MYNAPMFNKDFLKILTVLYVEDDSSIRNALTTIFKKVFKEIIVCVDGKDGIDKFKKYKQNGYEIDAIVSDINMPEMNGLEMLAQIRKLDSEVPAILTTAHGESNFLMQAIKVNVSYYALKPVNTPLLLENIQKFCLIKHHRNLIKRKEKELSSYIDIIGNVATIIKIDQEGAFIEANSLFSEVSLYTKDDIKNKNIKDVTHPDVLGTAYTFMQEKIKSGHNWEGLYKSINKNGDAFYLKITAIPEFDDNSNEMKGCTIIGFIATEDEQEKRGTMQKVRQNIISQRKNEKQLTDKIKLLEHKQKKLESNDSSFIQGTLERYKSKNTILLNQLKHYEKDIFDLEKKLTNIHEVANSKRYELMDKNKTLKKENETLKDNLLHCQGRLTRLEKRQK